MAKVLLINPSYQQQYGGNKTSVINPIYPTLGLATIAAAAEQSGHEVEIPVAFKTEAEAHSA